ncbi:hypothetical protein RIF29_20041 [Crotalaria pallida]|uniref:Uncharacterized protein n=1 Tax=Crotalaria pallida TaxID=3830 RepID=A0AAN9I8A2_CROPI
MHNSLSTDGSNIKAQVNYTGSSHLSVDNKSHPHCNRPPDPHMNILNLSENCENNALDLPSLEDDVHNLGDTSMHNAVDLAKAYDRKYGHQNTDLAALRYNSSSSSLWKAICTSWSSIVDNERWAIGNGETIHFWTDNWLANGERLIDHVPVNDSQILQWKLLDVSASD